VSTRPNGCSVGEYWVAGIEEDEDGCTDPKGKIIKVLGNGTDNYGFAAISGGSNWLSTKEFENESGDYDYSSTTYAWDPNYNHDCGGYQNCYAQCGGGFSVRCVQDTEEYLEEMKKAEEAKKAEIAKREAEQKKAMEDDQKKQKEAEEAAKKQQAAQKPEPKPEPKPAEKKAEPAKKPEPVKQLKKLFGK
jgi:hypothetical protein